jgi:hypothetical protein
LFSFLVVENDRDHLIEGVASLQWRNWNTAKLLRGIAQGPHLDLCAKLVAAAELSSSGKVVGFVSVSADETVPARR